MSKKNEKIVMLDSNDVIKDFNKDVPCVNVCPENVQKLTKGLSNPEVALLFQLLQFVQGTNNALMIEQKYISIDNLSHYLDIKYDYIRKLIKGLFDKNLICNYYVEIYDNKYIKAMLMNPNLARRLENIDSKYIELFENHKLIQINHALYSNNFDRSTPEYHQWIQDSLERDNYTCQCCGSTENLEVHHIFNYSQYKDLRTDLDNSITLCQCCHSPLIGGSFHNTYGTRNNTKEQLDEYLKIHKSSIAI